MQTNPGVPTKMVVALPDEVTLIADPDSDHVDLVSRVRAGVPLAALDNLVRALGVRRKEIAGVVGIA